MGRFANILPLILLFVGVGVLAFIGFVVYSIVQDVKSQTKKKMEKKNVMFSRDGMKVGIKEINDEEYKDRSQRYVALESVALRLRLSFHSPRLGFGSEWCLLRE